MSEVLGVGEETKTVQIPAQVWISFIYYCFFNFFFLFKQHLLQHRSMSKKGSSTELILFTMQGNE